MVEGEAKAVVVTMEAKVEGSAEMVVEKVETVVEKVETVRVVTLVAKAVLVAKVVDSVA